MAKTRMMTQKGECYLCGKIGNENRRILHEDAQRAFEVHWGTRDYFRQIFGRNYLDEETP